MKTYSPPQPVTGPPALSCPLCGKTLAYLESDGKTLVINRGFRYRVILDECYCRACDLWFRVGDKRE